ncbi:MAG: multiheme c-type cytochrome [Candidatus Eisenbacteria bacterium]|uniref:Cytochrome c-552/4 domain-containing protein n=1 Tax=Eiseniibacteriota bacterium TaxID=2212470 RepID=A0A956M169_UNCEI|nr:hypothetical protein [Candidatus Eisenbacteria bacterium]
MSDHHRRFVHLDLGNFMSTQDYVKDLRNRFLWDEMGRMGVDATTPGQRELSEWDLYTQLMAEGKVPVVSSNLTVETDGKTMPLGHRKLVLDKDGIRVGLFGLISGTNFASSKLPIDVKIGFEDPLDVARTLVPELRKESDVVVLMSELAPNETEHLVEEVPGIDVALQGDRALYLKEANRIGATLINQSGSRGQYLGSVTLVLDPDGHILDWGTQNDDLDKDWPEEPQAQARVGELEDQCARILADERERAQQAVQTARSSDRYLGAETCARCHAAEYAQWRESPHAHAFETLQDPHGMQVTDECVSCHVTGYDQPNGYVAESATPDLRGVQCEACHGRGSDHARRGGTRKLGAQACTGCHTGEFGKDFDFARAVELVKHTR